MLRRPSSSSSARLASVAGIALALLLTGCNQPPKWNLEWEDPFDGPAGTPPDPAYWDHDVGGGGWGNAQLEFDTDRPENASLDGNGNLAITALRETYEGRSYTSARLVTRGRVERALGRWEARIRLPSGQGIWPAFWLLGANFPEVGWPACGEIDVMELRGQDPTIVNGSLHATGYSGGGAITRPFVCEALPTCTGPSCTSTCTFDADYHVFAVNVEADRIRFEVDGNLYQSVRRVLLPTGSSWPFDAPFYVILNIAVGGNYVGAPDVNTDFPQVMLVDYVRYYSLSQ